MTTPADAEGSPAATEAPSALGDPPVAGPEALPVTGGRLSAVVMPSR